MLDLEFLRKKLLKFRKLETNDLKIEISFWIVIFKMIKS